ncbi:MAG TPA: BTAD domain-containing putative transcriptional regulator [Gemmatimonadaceae bacterium]|nr:BTAD domain-containing putative transcriptional regulator [Gemmatimonadaceae bacterium]
MSAIEFRTLGTLDLRSADGRELHSLLAQPKRIALLAYLCIAEPRGYHRRDTLLGLFWPDSDQEHARTSLRKSLHVLRRSLGDEAILSRGDDEVAVDFGRITCDAATFEDLVSSGQDESAVEAFTGDLLPGFFVEEAPEFERWLTSERTRLKSAAARAAYAAAERVQSTGDIIRALVFARRSMELDDADERSVRKLIELEAAAGNRSSAIRTYEAFASGLKTEYGTHPSAETIRLVEQVRSGDNEAKRAPRAEIGESHDPHQAFTRQRPITSTLPDAAGRSARREKIWFAVAAVAVVISGGSIWTLMRRSPSHQVVRYTLAIDSSETMAPGDGWWSRIAISPDGSKYAYVGGSGKELLVRRRAELRAMVIPMTRGAETPFFSPDGKHVGFLNEERVFIASLDGTLPIAVSDSFSGVAGASWASDGFIYVDGRGYQPLLRVRARAGATPEWFTTLDRRKYEIDHSWPDVLPNGKGVLFGVTSYVTRDSLAYAIAVAEIPSGEHHVIVPDAVYARYAASGHLLYITTSKQLMVVPFDQNSMRVTGEPKVLLDSMRLGRFGSADLAVSSRGTLIYATGGGPGRRELVWVTRDGRVEQVDPDWVGDFWSPALSPQGERLAIARRLNSSRWDIMVKRLDRGPSVKLTLIKTDGVHPAWTPDGKYVTYSEDEVAPAIWRMRADGIGAPKLLFREHRWVISETWSRDGKWLLYSTSPSLPDSGDILAFRPGIDVAPRPLIATSHREGTPTFSPDGRWLAYSSDESGQPQIYVVPFPNIGDGRWAVSAHGGADPQWSHRGNELFYRDSAGFLVAAEITTTPNVRVGRETRLFSTEPFEAVGFFALRRYAVSADDQRFLMIRRAKEPPEQLVVVENWFDELADRREAQGSAQRHR